MTVWPGHEYAEGGGPGPVAAALRLCRGRGCLGGGAQGAVSLALNVVKFI